MTSKSRMIVAVAGALSMGAVATYAADAQPDARIAELEAKVAQLEAKQATNSKDVASTIDSVLRDAEKRSQLLQNSSNMGAGYDNGFFISAGEGWTLRPGAFFQFRNVTNWRSDADDDGTGDDDDEIENGFEIRRMRLEHNGTAFTRDLEYSFVWDTARNGGSVSLLDAWVKYMFADDWGFRAGQFKDLTTHEKLVSAKRQLAVDRSLLDTAIGGNLYDRVQGVSLIYGGYNQNNPINAEAAFHDGLNSKNTDFTKPDNGPGTEDDGSDFGVAGRLEWKAMGDWRAYRDFTAMGNKEDLLVLGVAGDWTQFGDGDVFLGTVDAQWENAAGLGIYGAAIVNHRDEEISGIGDDSTDWGALVQVGYMLNPAWELFGRVSYTEFDQEVDLGGDSEDTFWELTVGVNYYLGNNGSAGHRAKVTIDVTYLPDGSPEEQGGLGYLGNSGDDEIVVRGQFQLLI
jgi:hypothetical protein